MLPEQVGAFKLHMKRAVGKSKEAPPAPAPSPAAVQPVAVPENGSPATSKPAPATTSITTTSLTSPDNIFHVLEQAVNEGLSFVTSPKVTRIMLCIVQTVSVSYLLTLCHRVVCV